MRTWAMAVLVPLTACGAMAAGGDAQGSSRSYDIADFSAVSLRGSDDVIVTVSPAFAVRAEGPAEQLDRLEIDRDGSTLRIGRKRGSGVGWMRAGKGVTVRVSMPAISNANLAGSGDLRIDRVTGGAFSGAVAGSGDLVIDAMQAAAVKLSLAGSGDIAARGTVDDLTISLAGSGDVDARALKAARGRVSIAGSGDVDANFAGPVAVSIVGSGDARLGPDARCTISTRGTGDARCG